MPVSLIELMIRLILVGSTTFVAILLWSRTRDPAWMMLILGIVLLFGGIVYDLLTFFGITRVVFLSDQGKQIAELILKNLPFPFMFTGFLIAARRRG